MTRVLIVYGTTDGHTRKIAGAFADTLEQHGIAAHVLCADARSIAAGPEGYDAVVVAASLHARGYQRHVRIWITRHAAELNRVPGMFLSVCLGVLNPDPAVQRDVRDIPRLMLEASGWRPERINVVAGALPYTRYGWLKKRIMRHMARKAGGATDMTRDHEYTDWNELRRLAGEFVSALAPAATPASR